MKEKTIEEKAKAYDEFLKRAEELYNKGHLKLEDLEYISGDDLKEDNKEKKLIETLINLFTHYKIEKVGEFTNNQIVDWLKKQLKKPEKYEWSGKITSRKAKGKLSALLKDLESRKKTDNRPIFRIGDTLKKKGKDYTFTVDRIQGGYYHCDHNNGAFFPIVEQYDWELLDDGKLSPKFKAGDWITNGLCTFKISSIDDNYYWSHEDTVGGDIESTNDQYHLWNILDAKDGDVIVDKSDGTIGIFQSIGSHPDGGCCNDPSYCFLHCYYDGEFLWMDFERDCMMDSDDVVPATKEQREVLMKAMTDGGWEFDFEKKELKKIEQNPVKISNKGDRDKELSISLQIQSYLNTASDELYGNGKPLYTEKHLKGIHECMKMWEKLHNNYFYSKQKGEWSEEDERLCQCLIKDQKESLDKVRNDKYGHSEIIQDLKEMYRERIDWLESLKQKVQ